MAAADEVLGGAPQAEMGEEPGGPVAGPPSVDRLSGGALSSAGAARPARRAPVEGAVPGPDPDQPRLVISFSTAEASTARDFRPCMAAEVLLVGIDRSATMLAGGCSSEGGVSTAGGLASAEP